MNFSLKIAFNIGGYKLSISNTIKEYTKKRVKHYEFKCYLGVDKLTGKPKYTTRRGFKTKSEAQKALIKVKYDFNNNNLQVRGKETFLDIYNLWIKQYEIDVEESTLKKTKGLFRNHILPAIGEFIVSNLNSLECQKHVNNWSEKVKSAKILKSYASNVMDFAVKHSFISLNPFSLVSVPKKRAKANEVVNQNENFYTKEELVTFLQCLKENENPKIHAFFHLLAFSGMRKGEAFALQWKDIDFSKKTITINKALSQGVNNKLYVKCTKTGKPRVIHIDVLTLDILKTWRKTQFDIYETLGFNILNPEQLIFSNLENQHIQPSITSRWLHEILTKYELPDISAHGLRHTHCTLLSEAQVDIKTVQQRLGHASAQTTLDIYRHVLESSKEKSVQSFVEYVVS